MKFMYIYIDIYIYICYKLFDEIGRYQSLSVTQKDSKIQLFKLSYNT